MQGRRCSDGPLSDNFRRFLLVPPKRRHHSAEALVAAFRKPTHSSMVRGDAGPLSIIQNRGRARLVDDIILGVFEIRLLLLPKKVHAEF